MPKKNVTDLYANRAFVDVTMSAANTLTFQQIRFGVGTFQGVGLQLLRVDWYPTGTALRELVAATDSLNMALTARDDLTSLDPSNQAIYCKQELIGVAAVAGNAMPNPWVQDFTDIGGILIPPNPLFIAATTAGAAAATQVRAVIYYKFIQLSDQESLEVLQTLIPGNV